MLLKNNLIRLASLKKKYRVAEKKRKKSETIAMTKLYKLTKFTKINKSKNRSVVVLIFW